MRRGEYFSPHIDVQNTHRVFPRNCSGDRSVRENVVGLIILYSFTQEGSTDSSSSSHENARHYESSVLIPLKVIFINLRF